MKIILATHTYKDKKDFSLAQRLSVESILKVKEKFPEIDIVNITFSDEQYKLNGFINIHTLTRSAREIIPQYFDHPGLTDLNEKYKQYYENIKKIPAVTDILNSLIDLNGDIFIFMNDDNIISDRFIKNILEDTSYGAWLASRIHTFGMESLSGSFTPESYSVHGFDAIAIKKTFWLTHRKNFPDLILGRSYWDTHFYTLCQLLGKTKTLNKLPPVLFHNEHGSTSQSFSIERTYNEDVFNRDIVCNQLWYNYVYNVLLKRPTVNNIKWYQPFDHEENLEKSMFKESICNLSPIEINDVKLPELTKNKNFDVILPCAPKDFKKLPFVIESLELNLENKNKIFVVTPKQVKDKISDSNIVYTTDKEVLNLNPLAFKFRPNWIYQQLIKLFQNVTDTEYYLTFDVDGVLNRKLSMFEENNPIWYYGWRQNHLPYFLFNWYVLGLEKSNNHTFIGDMCFFNKKIINALLESRGLTVKSFIERSSQIISLPVHISESEMYGSFITKHFKNYKFKQLKQYQFGKNLSDNNPNAWSEEEIKKLIGKYKNSDYDIIQMHSWVCASENHWE